MATYADTYETPKQEGGLLSRMFNALTPKFLKDYIADCKSEWDHYKKTEIEPVRQSMIENAVNDIMQSFEPENYDKGIEAILINAKKYDTNFHDFGKITFEDLRNHIDSLSENEKGAHKRPSPSVETATFEA